MSVIDLLIVYVFRSICDNPETADVESLTIAFKSAQVNIWILIYQILWVISLDVKHITGKNNEFWKSLHT